MAKADLILPNGTKVNIEGTAEEVAVLLRTFSHSHAAHSVESPKGTFKVSKSSTAKSSRKSDGPTGLIEALAGDGYFKSKKTIGDIQKELEQQGHIYAQTSLSPVLVRLTRKRTIRRLKEKGKGWVYVQ
jgi:hypothetical protein